MRSGERQDRHRERQDGDKKWDERIREASRAVMRLALDPKTVAYTGFCHDVDGAGGILLQLPSQVRDVHPQHVQLSPVSHTPHLPQQLLTCEALAPRADQGL